MILFVFVVVVLALAVSPVPMLPALCIIAVVGLVYVVFGGRRG